MIRHTTNVTGEFERKRRTNVCNSADEEDSPHNRDRLGSGKLGWVGGGVGLGGLRSRGLDRRVGPGGFGVGGVRNTYG